MKVLFVIKSTYNFSYIASVAEALDRSCEVELLFDEGWSRGVPSESVREFLARSNAKAFWLIRRSDFWRKLIFPLRELRSYLSYKKRSNQSGYYTRRWESYLPNWMPKWTFLFKKIGCFEKIVPPDRGIVKDLLERKPDIVIASPMNHRFCEEVEYVKAAKSLGIPTAVIVLSWDNLTTKGLFHVAPDLTLVWSNAQRDEAVEIHSIPRDSIKITGAPLFDKWLNMKVTETRYAFCDRVGINPEKPFCLYFGSSQNIVQDETWLIKSVYDQLDMGMIVRPHPANSRHYSNLPDDILVYPKDGELPESVNSQQDFFNAIYHCEFTIGVNTSAMIDSVVLDKRCNPVITDAYRATQTDTIHFQHLLPALNAGGGARQSFVKDYIRPHDKPPWEVAAYEIKATAGREKTRKKRA